MSEFPLTAGGFSAAQTSADVYRLGGFLELQSPFVFRRFRDDCCRVWGVWWLPSTGAMTIRNIHDIVAPPLGWHLKDPGPFCCELAAASAGGVGACSQFRLSTGELINFPPLGPVPLGPGPLVVGSITIPAATTTPTSTGPATLVCKWDPSAGKHWRMIM